MKALDKLAHNNSPSLEEKVSEVQVGDPIEGELEEGEVSGELGSDENFVAEDAAVTNKISEEEVEGEDEGVVDYRTEGLTPVVLSFSVDRKLDRAFGDRSSVDHIGKHHIKNQKRRQGKAVIAMQRKKTRTEEKEMGSLGPAQESDRGRRQQGRITYTNLLLCDMNMVSICLSVEGFLTRGDRKGCFRSQEYRCSHFYVASRHPSESEYLSNGKCEDLHESFCFDTIGEVSCIQSVRCGLSFGSGVSLTLPCTMELKVNIF